MGKICKGTPFLALKDQETSSEKEGRALESCLRKGIRLGQGPSSERIAQRILW